MDYQEAIGIFFAPAPEGTATPDVMVSSSPARRLRDAFEPLSMHAVWSPHTNAALAERGYDFLIGYVRGRGAPLGEVPGSVVAATFAVFEPNTIDALWSAGQPLMPLPELIALRDRTTTESLREVLGDVADDREMTRLADVLERATDGLDVTGRALFAALRAQPRLPDPYARVWRVTDLLREHRGDSHIAACVAAGLDPVRMGILMEVWLGYPVGEYSGTRAWPQEAIAAGHARLDADGLVADGMITDEGRRVRDAIEDATDLAQRDLVDALGGELDGVVRQLEALSARCIEARTFPPDVRKRAGG